MLSVPRELLRTARAVAAMRLMRSVEAAARSAGEGGDLRHPSAWLPESDHARLFEVFSRNGRWGTVRRGPELEAALSDARWEARCLGRTLEFSVRFEPSPAMGPRTSGGITAATRLVPGEEYFRVGASTSTLLEYWSRRRCAAVWYYLAYVQKLPLRPPLPSAGGFATPLLNRLADPDLRQAFALYNTLRERLVARGYDFPGVACRTGLPEVSWAPERLPEEVLTRLTVCPRGRAG
jgi:hypothetical protein